MQPCVSPSTRNCFSQSHHQQQTPPPFLRPCNPKRCDDFAILEGFCTIRLLDRLIQRLFIMSYADVAASGPKQSPEDAAAPQPVEIIPTEASTSSLVDVDLPSVHTVPSDFLDQEIQTSTQAARISREEEEAASRREQAKREAARAKAEAKRADNWIARQFSSLSDGTASAVVITNFAAVVGVSSYLGYRAWGLYERGRLNWQAVGWGVGILAGVGAVEAVLGRYLFKAKKNN